MDEKLAVATLLILSSLGIFAWTMFCIKKILKRPIDLKSYLLRSIIEKR